MVAGKETKWWNSLQAAGGWRNLVTPLFKKEGKVISDNLDRFIKRFYWQFRGKKGITQGYKPWIVFRGFEKWDDEEERLGYCHFLAYKASDKSQKSISFAQLSIFINQKYLLNWKTIGMDKLILSDPSPGLEYFSTPIDFENFKNTVAHELAHAYQYTVNEDEEKSSCESSGKKDRHGNYLYPDLVKEHTRLTNEIKQMITNYPEFENWWKKGYKKVPLSPADEKNEFESLVNLLTYNPTLEKLEKSFQEVKNHFLYSGQKKTRPESDNKEILNNCYAERKSFLKRQGQTTVFLTPGNKNGSGIGDGRLIWFLVIGLGVIGLVGILLILFGNQDKKEKVKEE